MLYDKDFLLSMDKHKNRTIYARITALTFDELPLQCIEGRVTQGSINIDGASAVRRTCSLTLVAQDFNYQEYYWGLNTRFKLEIGLENYVDSKFSDIIWFNQGVYIITSFSTAHSTNNFTINLQGKDKMCLLNGEVSGTINALTDFGTIEEATPEGFLEIRKIPIPMIIKNMIHQYGGEPFHNIVINDLEILALELLEYRYDTPMYLYREINSQISSTYTNAVLNGKISCIVDGVLKTLDTLTPEELDPLIDTLQNTNQSKPVTIDGKEYYVAKIEYGQTAGYRLTDLTFAGDLIANVGETITSVLDKIKNMLGEYEYFYDIDGRFVFQKKQSFVNTIWTPVVNNEENEEYVESLALASSTIYTFNEGELITSFNNSPNLLNMRNDFSIWGQRVSTSGVEIPIHLRFAIDEKPIYYKNFEGKVFVSEKFSNYSLLNNYILTDWREIIYQMALDFYQYNEEDDFEVRLLENNSLYYPNGKTGYEQYYIDLQGFWRTLYNPYLLNESNEYDEKIELQKQVVEKLKERLRHTSSTNLKEIENLKWELEKANSILNNFLNSKNSIDENQSNYYSEGNRKFWNKAVYEAPETLNFWFDFLDAEGDLSQFNVKTIGLRSKAINDNNVKSIYYRETPNIIFSAELTEEQKQAGYKNIQVGDIDSMFSISAQGKSAKNRLDELIFNHGYCIESVTINLVPVYHLQPNYRIHITDSKSDIDGDYIISKISIPLTYNGVMSITATKAAETILY